MKLRIALAALLAGALAPAARAAIPPIPIPSTPAQPTYVGAPARPHPIAGIGRTPRNPFMAPNGFSEIHDDGWQTDAISWGGPLGRSPETMSSMIARDCGSITFDAHGRLLSVCVGVAGPELYMFDPKTLATIATFALPPRQGVPSGSIFQDFTGGGYFYLDDKGRVVTATTTRHIYVIAETPDGTGFTKVRDYDLSHVLTPTEKITSALPDSHGLLWFVARSDGVVGTLNFATGAIHVVRLGHGADGEIENSFAVDQHGGVYIATDRKLYRFVAGRRDVPKITWRVRYPNTYEHKPGQVDDGTGTTPTVIYGGYVNITDNADPMDVVVYRTRVKLARRLHRMVCRVPVFKKGASADENSLIVAGRSMLVENNYGYTGPSVTSGGGVTSPGVRAHRHQPQRQGLPRRVAQRHRARPDGRLQAVARERADLHVHQGSGRRRPLVLDDAQLPHRAGRVQAAGGHGRRLQQQLRGDRARAGRHRVPRHARRDHRAQRYVGRAACGPAPVGACAHRRVRACAHPNYFNSADVFPSSSRATTSSWICWVPSKMSRILTSRAHFSSSSPSP